MQTLEVKIIITKIKSSMNGFNSIMEIIEGKMSELEDRMIKSPKLNPRERIEKYKTVLKAMQVYT